MLTVDVLIPVYRPGKELEELLDRAGETEPSHREDYSYEYGRGLLSAGADRAV